MEEKKEEILEIDTDQLQEIMNIEDIDRLPPIEIDFDDFDADEFQRGINDTSYLCGKVTALLNCGLSEGFILDYLLNQETIKHNLKTAKINRDMNVEMSKNQKATQEKYEL
jgi:hypothetical protein